MHKLETPFKYLNGEKVYTIKRVRTMEPCEICSGKGVINYNNMDIKCSECSGEGFNATNKFKYIVPEEPFIITETKIAIKNDNEVEIRYKCKNRSESLDRLQRELFFTVMEAQIYCDQLNK